MKSKPHYRAVFISDLHLGFRGSKTKNLLSFLKSIECENLYLVGDIFDLWAMKKSIVWDENSNAVLQRILKMSKNGTHIFYTPGNHDEYIRNLIPFNLGPHIQVDREFIYVSSDGKKYLIIHGDIFDFVIGNMKWLAHVGSFIYDQLIKANNVLHKIRSRLGYKKYWSLSSYLKLKAKKAVSFVKDFENAAIDYAIKKECNGVIVGHIHTAKISIKEDTIYANCGDWVESLTAIVDNGNLELIKWHGL